MLFQLFPYLNQQWELQWVCVVQLEGVDTGDFEAINAAAFLLFTESSKTIFIAVKDDDLPEADEIFTFNLTLQVQYLSTNHLFKILILCHLFVIPYPYNIVICTDKCKRN